MIAAIARGLHLSLDEHDHLFVLAGHNAPQRARRNDHVNRASRDIYPEEDHPMHGRVFTAQLRAVSAREGRRSRAAALAHRLLEQSPEFTAIWADHEIGVRYTDEKRMLHPELGLIMLHCQVLLDPDQSQSLLVYTATPGTEDYEKLQLLAVIGHQSLSV